MLDERILCHFNAIPPWPRHLHGLLALLEDDDVDVEAVVEGISADQGLLLRLLRVANSPFYSTSGKISSPSQAIQVIGLRGTRSMVIAAAVISRAPRQCLPEFDMNAFWSEAYGVACVAKALAAHLDASEHEVFTGGLLHDIGKIILLNAYRDDYLRLLDSHPDGGEGLVERERQLFGMDHAQIGAALANKWNFPDRLIRMLGDHHLPQESAPAAVRILHAADSIISCGGMPAGQGEAMENRIENQLAEMGCADFKWRAALQEARSHTTVVANLL